MLNSDMNSFRDNSIANQFIYNDTDGSGIYVENLAGSTMVKLKRHTLKLDIPPCAKNHQQLRLRNRQLCMLLSSSSYELLQLI